MATRKELQKQICELKREIQDLKHTLGFNQPEFYSPEFERPNVIQRIHGLEKYLKINYVIKVTDVRGYVEESKK